MSVNCCLNFQVQAVIHHNKLKWIDDSPYAFQNWYHPSVQNMFPDHFLFTQESSSPKNRFTSDTDFSFFHSETIQPANEQARQCAAVQIRPTLLPQWIMVPCGKTIPGASFVCEIKTNDNKTTLKNRERNIFRANRECSRKGINVGSSCLHIINSFSGIDYMVETACGKSGLDILLLPPFLFYPDIHLSWTRWRAEDAFFVKLLISMTHRWYTAFGQNPEHTDILVGSSPRSSGGMLDIIALRYSNTTLVGMEATDMNKHFSSSGLYIFLCNRSMLITHSFCLDGHAMCNDGTCILSHYVCDGRADCPDESDELDCTHVCSFSDGFKGDPNCIASCISPECVCHDLYFSCALGGCIPWSRVTQ